jgi:predicted nuclease of predicted toxin-antitoxin system
MKILVDENIPLISVKQLRKLGHDVLDIRSTSQQGLTDELLFKRACRQKRLLVTTDRGFAFYRHTNHYGILIVSLHQPNSVRINSRILEALKRFSSQQWKGLLVVMRDESINIWRQKNM